MVGLIWGSELNVLHENKYHPYGIEAEILPLRF